MHLLHPQALSRWVWRKRAGGRAWRPDFVLQADTCYMPDKIAAIYDKGILSAGRRDSLLNFPYASAVPHAL